MTKQEKIIEVIRLFSKGTIFPLTDHWVNQLANEIVNALESEPENRDAEEIGRLFEKEFGTKSDYFNHRISLFIDMKNWIVTKFSEYTAQSRPKHTDRPRIICICGSTRFADLHAVKRWEFEREGKNICLMINYLPEWYAREQNWNGHDHYGEIAGNKDILDQLHFRKIDLADMVYVINKDGYIGESTRNEINYAVNKGKPVEYMEAMRDNPEQFKKM